MKSKMLKMLLVHILIFALMICAPFIIFFPNELSSILFSDYNLLLFRMLAGLFCFSALILGVGGTFRPGITISRHLMKGDDLNNDVFKEQLQWFIFHVIESYVALLGLYLVLPEFFSSESMRLSLSNI
jgi:hypothetical protein